MKRKDLMPGDWVIWRTKFVQIETVSMNVNPFKIIDGFRKDVMIEEVKPIPITPSIIEKNEFHLDEMCLKFDVYRWKSLDGRIEIIKREDGTWSVHIDDEHYSTLGGFYCRYVHELQHALRLCGIDKEIQI